MNTQTEQLQKIAKPQNRNWRKPAYSVENDNDAFYIRVEMPGVSKDNFSITLNKSELSIEGKRNEDPSLNQNYIRRETPSQDFWLKLQLNVDVDGEKITANSENGVLTVTLPIAQAAKPRTIKIAD